MWRWMMIDDKPILIPFEAKHLSLLTPMERLPRNFIADFAQIYNELGIGWTALVGDGLIGSAGIVPLHQDVGHAWLLTGPLFKRYRLWAVKQIKREVNFHLNSGIYRRVQTFTPDGREFRGLAEVLGFSHEGTLRSYGLNGEDYHVYSIIRS